MKIFYLVFTLVMFFSKCSNLFAGHSILILKPDSPENTIFEEQILKVEANLKESFPPTSSIYIHYYNESNFESSKFQYKNYEFIIRERFSVDSTNSDFIEYKVQIFLAKFPNTKLIESLSCWFNFTDDYKSINLDKIKGLIKDISQKGVRYLILPKYETLFNINNYDLQKKIAQFIQTDPNLGRIVYPILIPKLSEELDQFSLNAYQRGLAKEVVFYFGTNKTTEIIQTLRIKNNSPPISTVECLALFKELKEKLTKLYQN